jgi:hypothetical protein
MSRANIDRHALEINTMLDSLNKGFFVRVDYSKDTRLYYVVVVFPDGRSPLTPFSGSIAHTITYLRGYAAALTFSIHYL